MIQDSGERKKFSTGMERDVTDGKVDYTLALDGPLFERLALHLTEGAKKYAKRNWMAARTEEEYLRFRESLLRHLIQYLRGDTDEDHFAAVAFNLNGLEYTRLRLEKAAKADTPDRRMANRRAPGHDAGQCLMCKLQVLVDRRAALPGRRKDD